MASPFLGQIILVPYNFSPNGYAFCNGQLLPISQNTALFALLGTTYGGNGIQTFALPDLRSRVPLHAGQGPGLSNYDLGQTAGDENVTVTQQTMPAHNHSMPGSTATGTASSPTNELPANPNAAAKFKMMYAPSGTVVPMDAGAIGAAGGDVPHSNIQPFLALSFCIALQGIFPSRN